MFTFLCIENATSRDRTAKAHNEGVPASVRPKHVSEGPGALDSGTHPAQHNEASVRVGGASSHVEKVAIVNGTKV